MQIKVSVVVPVYNTEKYLNECVDSLLNQTLKEVEYIFVDDGSTDRSVEILEEYQRKDDRVKIIKQKNLYAGVARNNGMNAATGKYIIFLDSDDFFELNMLEEAYSAAEKDDAEIVLFSYSMVSENGENIFIEKLNYPCCRILTKEEKKKIQWEDSFGVPWNKLLLRSFVDSTGIKYQEIKNTNDEFFNRMNLILAQRVVYIDQLFVHYRINNPNSLQRQKNKDLTCGIKFFSALKNELEDRNLFDDNIYEYARYLNESITQYFEYDNFISTNNLYEYIKENITYSAYEIVFRSVHDSVLERVISSESYSEYLWEKRKIDVEKKKTDVDKRSLDYRLGHSLLVIPRKIWHLIRRKGSKK